MIPTTYGTPKRLPRSSTDQSTLLNFDDQIRIGAFSKLRLKENHK